MNLGPVNITPTITLSGYGPGPSTPPQPTVNLLNGLLVSYPLTDGYGAVTLQDLSGYARTAGASAFPPSWAALNPFDNPIGSADFAPASTPRFQKIVGSSTLGESFIGRTWTLLVWFRITSLSQSATIAWHRKGPGGRHWEVWYDATVNRYRLTIVDSRTGTVKTVLGPGPSVNNWGCLAVRCNYDENEMSFGIRHKITGGAWEWFDVGGSVWVEPGSYFCLGFGFVSGSNYGAEGSYWFGQLYSANIWDRILAEVEISKFYETASYPWPSSGFWPGAAGVSYGVPEATVDLAASGSAPVALTWTGNQGGTYRTEVARADGSLEDFKRIAIVAGGQANGSFTFSDSTGTIENAYKTRHLGPGNPSGWEGPVQGPFEAPTISTDAQNNGYYDLTWTHPAQSSAAWGDSYEVEIQIDSGGWAPATGLNPIARTTAAASVFMDGAAPAGGELWEVRIRAVKGLRTSPWSSVSLTSVAF